MAGGVCFHRGRSCDGVCWCCDAAAEAENARVACEDADDGKVDWRAHEAQIQAEREGGMVVAVVAAAVVVMMGTSLSIAAVCRK